MKIELYETKNNIDKILSKYIKDNEKLDDAIREIGHLFSLSIDEACKRYNNPCAEMLDLLWKEIILARKPKYGDWEYPGFAYRHLMCEIEEMVQEAKQSASTNV